MSTSASVVSIGDTELQSGLVLPDLKISHSTFGTLNATRSNAILLPTFYGGKHSDYEPMIGVDKALDPSKYFIVVVDMMCNGCHHHLQIVPRHFQAQIFLKSPIGTTCMRNRKCLNRNMVLSRCH